MTVTVAGVRLSGTSHTLILPRLFPVNMLPESVVTCPDVVYATRCTTRPKAALHFLRSLMCQQMWFLSKDSHIFGEVTLTVQRKIHSPSVPNVKWSLLLVSV